MTDIAPLFKVDGQARGALPNGTRVEKCSGEGAERQSDGCRGTIVGSMSRDVIGGLLRDYPQAHYGYWVEWDMHPASPGFILDYKLRALEA